MVLFAHVGLCIVPVLIKVFIYPGETPCTHEQVHFVPPAGASKDCDRSLICFPRRPAEGLQKDTGVAAAGIDQPPASGARSAGARCWRVSDQGFHHLTQAGRVSGGACCSALRCLLILAPCLQFHQVADRIEARACRSSRMCSDALLSFSFPFLCLHHYIQGSMSSVCVKLAYHDRHLPWPAMPFHLLRRTFSLMGLAGGPNTAAIAAAAALLGGGVLAAATASSKKGAPAKSGAKGAAKGAAKAISVRVQVLVAVIQLHSALIACRSARKASSLAEARLTPHSKDLLKWPVMGFACFLTSSTNFVSRSTSWQSCMLRHRKVHPLPAGHSAHSTPILFLAYLCFAVQCMCNYSRPKGRRPRALHHPGRPLERQAARPATWQRQLDQAPGRLLARRGPNPPPSPVEACLAHSV